MPHESWRGDSWSGFSITKPINFAERTVIESNALIRCQSGDTPSFSKSPSFWVFLYLSSLTDLKWIWEKEVKTHLRIFAAVLKRYHTAHNGCSQNWHTGHFVIWYPGLLPNNCLKQMAQSQIFDIIFVELMSCLWTCICNCTHTVYVTFCTLTLWKSQLSVLTDSIWYLLTRLLIFCYLFRHTAIGKLS